MDTNSKNNIKREFAKYVSQNILGMIGISIYILADTFFISLAEGANGLTVLNLVLPLYGVIFAIGAMIGVGASIRYSIDKALGNSRIDYYFANAILWNIICSLPFIILGLFTPELVLSLMGADEYITNLGIGYTRIFMSCSSFFMMNYTFNAFVRNDHDPTVGMIASLSGSIFNIIFDYIFMFPLGMGLIGAALATGISPIVSICVTFIHYLGKNNHIIWKPCLPSIKLLFCFCQLGFASFIGELSSAITTIIFNFLILGLAGNIGVAAYGVIANLSLVAMAIFNGLSQGSQPLLSRYYGKGDMLSVKKIFKLGILTALTIELILLILSWRYTDYFISIFNSEQNIAMAQIAHTGLRIYFLGFIFAGINIFMISALSAMDKAVHSFIASLMRGVIAIGIFSILLSVLIGLHGVWLSFFVAEFITFLLLIGLVSYTSKQ